MKTETVQWAVYQINDCDWWLARSPEEARTSAAQFYGCAENDDEMIDGVPRLLELDELNRLKYYPDGNRNGTPHSFSAELIDRVNNNPKPGMFATTEF